MTKQREIELSDKITLALQRKRAFLDTTKDCDNPQVVEIRNMNNGAINAYLSVLDYINGSPVMLNVETSGVI